MKLCFYGCGNIAQAIIKGLIKDDFHAKNILVIERNPKHKRFITGNKLRAIQTNHIAQHKPDLIILCVKPKDVRSALMTIQDVETPLVSVAAGITVAKLKRLYRYGEVIRVMPMTGSAYRMGITALFGKQHTLLGYKRTRKLFKRIGVVCELKTEGEMHAFTGIIGGGQAYLYFILQNYQSAINAFSCNENEAQKILYNFVASMAAAINENHDLKILVNEIRSPGGTTNAGIKSLEKDKVPKAFKDAFKAAKERSKNIQNES
tara:strand:- start:7777 stop:8562 length:786 start_codon:yes stop_codon:yes gene_type:complete